MYCDDDSRRRCIMTLTRMIGAVCVFVFMAAGFLHAETVVISITGSVSYKTDKQWKPLEKGMKVSQGAKISTGVKSTAEIKMDGHVVTIKPLSMVMIEENKLSRDLSSNRIGLRRGSVRAAISKDTRVKTVFRISTPVATSSVRGTIEDVSYGPGIGMTIDVIEGHVEGENSNGNRKDLFGGLSYNQQNGKGPGDVMSSTQQDSSANTGDSRVSGEEKDSNTFLVLDTVDSGSDAPGYLDERFGSNKTKVSLNVIWP